MSCNKYCLYYYRIEKRAKYSRRRTHDEDADIDFINERNAKFNKKLERFYGTYTAEIKQNLERGTAVWCVCIFMENSFHCIACRLGNIQGIPPHINWAKARQNKQYDLWAQQRLISAWAFAQSDQSSLYALRIAKDLWLLYVDSEDSDQTGQMPRLIQVFAGCTGHFVCFVMLRLILSVTKQGQNALWSTASVFICC